MLNLGADVFAGYIPIFGTAADVFFKVSEPSGSRLAKYEVLMSFSAISPISPFWNLMYGDPNGR